MKFRKTMQLAMAIILLFGSLSLWAGGAKAKANDILPEFKEGNNFIYILKDGDGQSREFTFTTYNKLTADNTKIRLYNNQVEIDPQNYTVDYDRNTITLNKTPDPGAELYFTYSIHPTFEWRELISGSTYIGNTLIGVDGSTKVFKLTTNYILNSNKKVSLYIDGTKVPTSEFTFNLETQRITLSEKRKAPSAESKVYFYFPVTSIVGTKASGDVAQANPSLPPNGIETPIGTESPVPSVESPIETEPPVVWVEPEFHIPSGESYPGQITLGGNGKITINVTTVVIQPTYTTYLMVKNASNEVVRQIRVTPGKSVTYTLNTQLGLTTGGYYIYLKTVNQSGGLAASVPQFVPINLESKIQVFVEGKMQAYTQAPVNVNGNVLVPFRAIFESLGATVKWDSATQTVTATKEGKTIVLKIGSTTAYVNGVPVTLSAAPQLINGSTMVPIRFVSEALGGLVEWSKSSSSVIVFQNTPSIPTTAESEKPAQSEATSTSPILQKISQGITAPTDIVFVMDVTGSMGEVIGYVKETVKKFADSVPSGSNFSIVAYRDINYRSTYKDLEFFPFTNDKNVLKTNLSKLVAAGGGDENESGLEAIHMAAQQLAGRKNAKRIIFITDAPVHDKGASMGKTNLSLGQIINELKTNKITLDAIAPMNGLANTQIIQLVNAGKGKIYDIKKASVTLLEK
ncbi:stalk domain-containing protein [Paenibacillus sp. NPDC058177]|uniref:stalk domain-containing protein n=1 Tax=Paenibacillus sp. NPDC058177 TaxID=3346369 RepID=UPI0036DA1AA5